MKNILYFLLFVLLVCIVLLFVSCEKATETPNPLCGTYTGISTEQCPGLQVNKTQPNTIQISPGANDVLYLSTLGTIGNAQLDNTTAYHYWQMLKAATSCGKTSLVQYQGNGWLIGDSLFEAGTLVYSINGQTFTGTWQTRSRKQ